MCSWNPALIFLRLLIGDRGAPRVRGAPRGAPERKGSHNRSRFPSDNIRPYAVDFISYITERLFPRAKNSKSKGFFWDFSKGFFFGFGILLPLKIPGGAQ